MLAVGTRGDVQPYVALARGLQRAGHDIVIGTSANLVGFVHTHGLDAVAIAGDSTRWMRWLRTERRVRARRGLRLEATLTAMARDTLCAVRGAALVISGATAFWAGQPIARALGVPHCSAFVQPWHATSAFPQMLWPDVAAGPAWARRAYNRASHRLTLWGIERLARRTRMRALAAVLGADPPPRAADPLVLYGFSPALVPRPDDWPPNVRVTGAWALDDGGGWRPPARLAAFLAEGPAPVYVGFGSVAGGRPELLRAAVRAVRTSGRRGLLATGWGEWRDPLPAGVLAIDEAPHDWLLPRMAAVVHHAGAGTTAAALRAGRPAVVVPLLYDHAFFARRTWRLGTAPRPVPARRATVARLRAAIERATSDVAMAARAEHVGAIVAGEDGVGRAVELIERLAAGPEAIACG